MARIRATERRADLVAAAVRVIAAHGVDGATTRRIAEEASAPLAMLHYCFATKEQLFAAVFEDLAGKYREVLTRNDIHGDVQSTARALLRGVILRYRENPAYGATIVELISWGQREGAQAETVYNAAFETMRTILDGTTADGRTVDADTIDRLIYLVSALSDGFALNWLVFADTATADAQAELTVSALDAWMAANLEATPGGDVSGERHEQESGRGIRSLMSWVQMN